MRWLKLVATSGVVFLGGMLAVGVGVVAGQQVGLLMGDPRGGDTAGVFAGYVVLFLYVFVVIALIMRSRRRALQREMEVRREQVSSADRIAVQAARNAEQIGRHYALFRTQAAYSFAASVTGGSVGIVVLFIAVLTSDGDVAWLTGVGGLLSEVLAGSLFLLHLRADKHVTRIGEDLRRGEALLLAAQLIADMPDSKLKETAQRQLIEALINDGEIDHMLSPAPGPNASIAAEAGAI